MLCCVYQLMTLSVLPLQILGVFGFAVLSDVVFFIGHGFRPVCLASLGIHIVFFLVLFRVFSRL